MGEYEKLLGKVYVSGEDRGDRTGTGTRSLFGEKMVFDLREGFPLVTTKKVSFDIAVKELLWVLSGSGNVKPLQEQGVHVWDEWADEQGQLGPIYGAQWRDWEALDDNMEVVWIDQVELLLEGLRDDPYSRRHILTTWNPGELHRMALPPCHDVVTQFYVADSPQGYRFLDCQMYQRSGDMFLGVPFNIAESALLMHMIAQQVNLVPRYLHHVIGDAHIYLNHLEQVKEQLTRVPYASPTLALRGAADLFSYKRENFRLLDYNHHPAIKGEVSV